ncbi:MAG: penicillin-binding protein 2, partial [Pseudomonas sp.]
MPQPIPLKDHEKEKRLVNRRLIACAVFVLALSFALVGRLYFLQVIEFAYHSTISENNRVHVLPIPPERGVIYDRNGVVLATNRPSFNMTLTRERAGDYKHVLD